MNLNAITLAITRPGMVRAWNPLAPPTRFMLIEDASFLLQEDGFKIGLEP